MSDLVLMRYFLLSAWVFGHIGVNTYFIKPMSYTILLAVTFVFLCIFCIIQSSIDSLKPYQKTIFYISRLVCASGMVFLFVQTNMHHSFQERLKNRILEKANVKVLVYIDQLDQIKDQFIQQDIQVFTPNLASEISYWRTTLPLKKYKHNPLKLGNYYWLEGDVDRIHGYATPYAFDKEKWSTSQNIMGTFRITKISPITESELKPTYEWFTQSQNNWYAHWRVSIEKKRLDYREQIAKSSFKYSGLLLALLTGDESLTPNSIKTQFQYLGISHLLAISGPHILIFSGILTWVLHSLICLIVPNLYLRIPKQYVLAIPFWLGVLFYCAFVGFEIPAVRTLVTVTIITISLFIRQKVSAFFIVLFSASVMLWFDPLSVLSAAFWLSYGACFVLIRIYQIAQKKIHLNFFKRIVVPFIVSQWQVFIALLPLTIIFFHQISWFAPLSNLIAIPLLGAVAVPLIIVGAIFNEMSPLLGNYIFQLADYTLSFLLILLNYLEKLPFNLSYIPFNYLQITLLVLSLFILFLPKKTIPKAWSFICLLPLILPLKHENNFHFYVLDVGQGQSIFIEYSDYSFLIDTGGNFNESQFSLAQAVLLPFLNKNGISQLDHVILSHLDQDHSGAFSTLKRHIPIKHVMSNIEPNDLEGIQNFAQCHEGQFMRYDHLELRVLSPDANGLRKAKDHSNEYSCVVYVSYKNEKKNDVPALNFLIMADAGQETEQRLIDAYPNLAVDVLVLGHHGSRYSSSENFLAHYHPKIAIASAGYHNRYGHPHMEVQDRLTRLGIPLWVTSEKGTIQISTTDDGQMTSKSYRN